MDDLIDRQAAIDAVSEACFELRGVFGRCEDALKALPSAQQEPEEFEWCTDCKEYDQTAHCCHRWTKVIRQTVDELKQPTVDAVPVIRCYECKYFREFEKGFSTDWNGSCKYWNTHSTVYSNFCGCAERKEE